MFDFSLLNICIRLFGLLGIASTVAAYQCKKHSWMIGLRTANELLFAAQYLLLGGYTGAALNVLSSCRNIIFIERVKKEKSTNLWRIVFSVIFIIISIFTFSGFPTVIFCVGKVITTYVYGSRNLTFVRVMTIVTGIMWITYNFILGAYEAIAADLLTVVSAGIAIRRIDMKAHREKKEKARSRASEQTP